MALLRHDLAFHHAVAPAIFTKSLTSARFNLHGFNPEIAQDVAYLKLFIMHAPNLIKLELFVPQGSHEDPALMDPLIPMFKNCCCTTHLNVMFQILPYLKYFPCTLQNLNIILNFSDISKMADVLDKQNVSCLRKLSNLQVRVMPELPGSIEDTNDDTSKVRLEQLCLKLGIQLGWLD